LLFAGVASILQICVVGFLVFKRRQFFLKTKDQNCSANWVIYRVFIFLHRFGELPLCVWEDYTDSDCFNKVVILYAVRWEDTNWRWIDLLQFLCKWVNCWLEFCWACSIFVLILYF
jgi:hypothetical protein